MNTALEIRFISRILREEAANMDQAQKKVMSSAGFQSRKMTTGRSFLVKDNQLIYTHRPEHRFVDMSTRKTKLGTVKKIAHPIHNKILWGYANNIVQRIGFEFTQETKEMLLKEFPKLI